MTPELQLDVLALVRSRLESNDENFYAIIEEKTNAELIELLSLSAAFSGMVIAEMLDKLRTFVPEAVVSLQDSTPLQYLDSAIKEVLNADAHDGD